MARVIDMTAEDIYALVEALPHIEDWEYHGARYCPHPPPTEQELDHYVRTGLHPLRPSSLRIW